MAMLLDRKGEFYDSNLMKRSLLALNEQRHLSRFCDIILRVCNTDIYAHSNILAAASPYFSSFLGTGTDCPRTFCQKQPQIIEIHIDSVLMKEDDCGYGEAVSKVVDYMYSSKISLTTIHVSQIIEIAKIMSLDKLVEFCVEFQKGVDDNKPRDVFTCTSGLYDIIDLLGSRSRIIKRANAATETDDILFAKLKSIDHPNPICLDKANASLLSKVSMKHRSSSRFSSKSNSRAKSVRSISSGKIDAAGVKLTHVVNDIGNDSVPDVISQRISEKQKDNEIMSSLFDGSRPPHLPLNMSDIHADDESKSQIDNSVAENFLRNTFVCTVKKKRTVDSLKNLSSLAIVKKSRSTHFNLLKDVTAKPISKLKIQGTDIWPLQNVLKSRPTVENTISADITFAMTADRPTRSTTPSTEILSIPQTVTSCKRGRSSRGQGRRRGRPRGRQKKDLESDPEFEEFMKCLEKGIDCEEEKTVICSDESFDNEGRPIGCSTLVVRDMACRKEDPYYVPVRVNEELHMSAPTLSSTWKSPRVRSKPSQLKRDYILHSLSKKSCKPHGKISGNERTNKNRQVGKGQASSSEEKTSNSLQFLCQKCDFSTTIFKEYRHHLRSHPETNPRFFVCSQCNFKTTKSREYTSHRQMHMIQDLVCIYCDFQASSPAEYEEHKEKHSGEFPYFCTECDSKFKKKTQLISHKAKHQVAKPFVCAVCCSGFKWKHALKNHMITHCTTKDHLCDVCGYATAHKSQLKAHKLIHTGQTYKCSVIGCHFEATRRQKLKYHMVTHTHEKPHQCDVCGQRFSLNKNMRRHMLLHTNTRPYACKICSFTTTRYDKLKEHNLKVHNIGEISATKRVPVDYLVPNVTYVKSEDITANPDGSFSEEMLQTIAQLAASQQVIANTSGFNVEGQAPNADCHLPIIARIQYTQVDVNDDNLQFIE